MYQGSSPFVSSTPPKKKNDNLKDVAFLDKYADIHDPILSSQSMYEAIKIVMESIGSTGDILNLFNSNLIRVVVPQTYNYPELVQ